MDISNLDKLNTILERYKLPYQILNNNDIEIGGRQNIKYLKRYYFNIPLIIGSVIVLIGFLIDFTLFKFVGVPFLLYAIYGIRQIYIAIRENGNTTIISNGEIKISKNNKVSIFNVQNIKNYEIKTERLNNEMHLSQLLIIDKENKEQVLFTLIDAELSCLEENVQFLKDFILLKMNATKIP